MPPSLPRQAVSLHLSVSSRNVSVFAHNVKARHLLPAHVTFHPAMREGQQISRGCNVRFMLRPVKLLAPLRRPPLLSRGSGYFYFRACPQSVTLMRVGYNYLGEQTIPRTGLSPAGITALWAARTPDLVKPADPASRLGTVSGQVQPACYHTNPPSAYISKRATDMITSFQVIR